MKILSIKLKNINSLRGEHELHFDRSPLLESGLFGIVGATGSGKSTILDCITLALYGRVPRIGLISKAVLDKGGVILTKFEKECYAEVIYTCKKGKFKAIWLGGKTRNNTFRQPEMKLLNEADELLSESLSTATQINTANIGLDYDQFIKSILLCQGDFARFLQSDKNKRAELLEKITGTREFRKIGKKAFRAFASRQKELEIVSEAINMNKENVLDKSERSSLEESVALMTKNFDALTKQHEQEKLKLAQKKRIFQLKTAIEAQQMALQLAEAEVSAFHAQYGHKLATYSSLIPYKESLAEHQLLTKRVEELSQNIVKGELKVAEHQSEIEKLVRVLSVWLSEEVSEHDYLAHLDAFRDRVMNLTSRLGELERNMQSGKDRMLSLLNLDHFKAECKLFRVTGNNELLQMKLQARIQEEQRSYENLLRLNNFTSESLYDTRKDLLQRNSRISMLMADVRLYTEASRKLKTSVEKIAELNVVVVQQTEALTKLKNDVELLEEKYRAAEKEKEQLMNAERLEDLRASLSDDEPCPLCGSLHHPYLHEFANTVLNKVDLYESARLAFQTRKQECEQVDLLVRANKAVLNKEQEHLTGYKQEQEKYLGAIELWKKDLHIEKLSSEENVKRLQEENQDRLDNLELCLGYKKNEPELVRLGKELATYDSICESYQKLKTEMSSLYPGANFQQDYQHKKETMLMQQDRLKLGVEYVRNNRKELGSQNASLSSLITSLTSDLDKLGFSDISSARNALIGEIEQKNLESKQKDLDSQVVAKRTALETMGSQFITESQGDDSTIDLNSQEKIVLSILNSINELKQPLDAGRSRLSSDDLYAQEMRKREEDKKRLQEALRPWEMLNKLIGDANGNKFNTRAQELSLQQLLIFANRRMDKLHSRYTLLPENLEEEDLRVADGYMGGEVRSVKSLSGGETFVISLALALGLSDLAARDIKIDSLFIDEGFGSLDPETLEEAMFTLEQLQTESNKTVGIISHVESLKERIYTQVRLEKNNSGFSTISVFPSLNSGNEQAEKS